jgi:hypothetical protein
MMIKRGRHSIVALALFMGLVAYWGQAVFNIAQSFTSPMVYVYLAVISSESKHLKTNKSVKGVKSYGKQAS